MNLVEHIHPSFDSESASTELDSSYLSNVLHDKPSCFERNDDVFRIFLDITYAESYQVLPLVNGIEQAIIDQGSIYESVDENSSSTKKYDKIFNQWEIISNLQARDKDELGVEELLFTAVTGLLSNNIARLKDVLSNNLKAIEMELNDTQQDEWHVRLRNTITSALLFLTKQSSYSDIRVTNKVIDKLSKDQLEIEANWIQNYESKKSYMATKALGLYHLAYAVRKTSEYISTGDVVDPNGQSKNFDVFLKRILNKADRYFLQLGNHELISWSASIALCLWALQKNSIWHNLGAEQELIKKYLETLTDEYAQTNIYSLLPSQKDALSKHLLDTRPIARVLQMPTSAGKSLLAEVVMLQTFQLIGKKTRILYLVPTKSLVNQVRINLTQDFNSLEIDILTAGSTYVEDPFEDDILKEKYGIFISTPEKAELLLRTKPDWFKTISLIVIDEAHNLSSGARGARLELFIANCLNENSNTKYLLLSPFLQNGKDIGNWLSNDPTLNSNIIVDWRPSKILMGLPKGQPIEPGKQKRDVFMYWDVPDDPLAAKKNPTKLLSNVFKKDFESLSKQEQIKKLFGYFKSYGNVLGMFPGSRKMCEESALNVAKSINKKITISDNLRLTIDVAKLEYGEDSDLVKSLKKGVAFHHSGLSPEMKFLIEDATKSGNIAYLAATTTIAQGMNFPVSSILIHSTSIAYGKRLSVNEFRNIAGRAGRVGLSGRGLLVFANTETQDVNEYQKYVTQLSEPINSALITVFKKLGQNLNYEDIKQLYYDEPTFRPFIQYIAHSLVVNGKENVIDRIESILEASFANKQIKDAETRRNIRFTAINYLKSIFPSIGIVSLADGIGVSNFSLSKLSGIINQDKILSVGPEEIVKNKDKGYASLISAVNALAEFDLRLEISNTPFNPELAGIIVDGWVNGDMPVDLAAKIPTNFIGNDREKIYKSAHYLYSKVSGTLSWGANTYLRALSLNNDENKVDQEMLQNLPSYIQYGVSSSTAALACQYGVPRIFSSQVSQSFEEMHGKLNKNNALKFHEFIKDKKNINFSGIENSLNKKLTKKQAELFYKKYLGI